MAYHGKSIYDPEGGAVKAILLHAIRQGLISVTCAYDFMKHAQRLCTNPTSQYQSQTWNIRKRFVLLLERKDIDRSFSTSSEVGGITEVHKTYVFRTVRMQNGSISRRWVDTRSIVCRCEPCMSFLPKIRCQFLNQVGPWKRQEFLEEHSSKQAKALLEQLFLVLYRDFRVHKPTEQVYNDVKARVSSKAHQKSIFRTNLLRRPFFEWFDNRRAEEKHLDEKCACGIEAACWPRSHEWKNDVHEAVVDVVEAVMRPFLPRQLGQDQSAKRQKIDLGSAEATPLVLTSALLGRRFRYNFESHGWCTGVIFAVREDERLVELKYDTDSPNSSTWDTSFAELEEDFLAGDFVIDV